jgi:hypothetical protein
VTPATRFLPVVLLLVAFLSGSASARDLKVHLVTVSPGELVWERYGHNLLIFEDPADGWGISYDWGRFDFDQPGFILRFLRGEMIYATGRVDAANVLDFYVNRQGRGVLVQRLDLTPEQTIALLRACETSYLPENREYEYDYFTANCSTRLRDVVDEALAGELRKAWQGVDAGTTYRIEGERHMAPDWPVWFGMQAGFGMSADRPLDAWRAAFVPATLAELVREVEIDGRPLVAAERVLQADPLPPVPQDRPSRAWATGLIGIGIAAAMVALRVRRLTRMANGVVLAWMTFTGLAGLLGVCLWAFTEHVAGHANQTVLAASPLGLAVVAALLVKRWRRLVAGLAMTQAGLAGLAVVLYAIPGLGQENGAALAFFLPPTLAAAWVVTDDRPRRDQSPDARPAAA